MKRLISLIFCLLVLISCGRRVHNYHDSRIDGIEDRLTVVEKKIVEIYEKLDNINYSLSSLNIDLNSRITDVYNTLTQEANDNNVAIYSQINKLEKITEELTLGTVEVLDPCDEDVFNQEIVLRLGSGELIAVYYTGSQSYLASLNDGSYITTDSRKCKFKVIEGQLQ